jgi:hypothetical protein
MTFLVDSYSEVNAEVLPSDWTYMYSGYNDGREGQSFACSLTGEIDSVEFYLNKLGSPSGNMYAEIWSHTGTYGVDGIPLALLATSDAVAASSVGISAGLISFPFSGGERITLSSGSKYCVILYHVGTDVSNCIRLARDFTTVTHAGINVISDAGWFANAADVPFYVYAITAPISVSVNDTITISESKTLAESDLEISKVETVSLTEYAEVFKGIPLTVDVYDSIIASPVTGINIPIVRAVSINDTVGISEYAFINLATSAGVDPRPGFGPTAPVWSLTATGSGQGLLNSKAPTAEGSGISGAFLDKKAGVAICAGTASFTTPANLSKKSPVYSLESLCGAIGELTAPTANLSAESYSVDCRLDKKAPVATGEGTAHEENFATLAATAPFWKVSGTGYGQYAVLDAKAPVWYGLSISATAQVSGSLDEKAPVAKVVYGGMLAYDGGGELNANSPTGTMSEDTGAGDTDRAGGIYADRFANYTMEYSG